MLRELLARRSAGWPVRPCQTQTGSCRASPFLFAPIFLGFTLHRRCRVLHFEPIGRAPRAIRRVLPLRHNAFETHLAGTGEGGRAVAFDMFIEPDAGRRAPWRQAWQANSPPGLRARRAISMGCV